MNDVVKGTLVGDPVEIQTGPPIPKTRQERIEDWKQANKAEYNRCKLEVCNCAPTRAELLMVEQYEGRANPPID